MYKAVTGLYIFSIFPTPYAHVRGGWGFNKRIFYWQTFQAWRLGREVFQVLSKKILEEYTPLWSYECLTK